MYCGQCGKENSDLARFCVFCGTTMARGTAEPPPGTPSKAARRVRRLLWVGPIGLVLLVAIVLGLVMLAGKGRTAQNRHALYLAQANFHRGVESELVDLYRQACDDPLVRQEAVADLVQRLGRADESQEKMVYRILGEVAPDWPTSPGARDAVPALVQALGGHRTDYDPSPSAGRALERIGGEAVARQVLQLGLQGEQRATTLVCRTLDRIQPNWRQSPAADDMVDNLIEHISDYSRPSEYGDAIDGLALLGSRKAIGPLIDAITVQPMPWASDPTSPPSPRIFEALGRIDVNWPQSPEARSRVPAMIELLENLQSSPPLPVVLTLSRIKDPRALEAMILAWIACGNELRHRAPQYRAALEAFDKDWKQKPAAQEAIRRFIDWLAAVHSAYIEPKIDETNCAHLAEAGADAAIAAWLDCWPTSWRVRLFTQEVRVLERIDPKWADRPAAREKLPRLLEAAGHEGPDVRKAADAFLRELGSPPATP